MTPEQMLARQISMAVLTALTASANGGMEEVLKRAEDAIRAAIAQEREECAKVADDAVDQDWPNDETSIQAKAIAELIRARGQ